MKKTHFIILASVLFFVLFSSSFLFSSDKKESSFFTDSAHAFEGSSGVVLISPQNARLVRLINELQTLKFSRDIFESPSFKRLIDKSVSITRQNPGKVNPFDEIGRGGLIASIPVNSSATSTTSGTSTPR
jgi:hypothetical protein